MTCVQGKHEQQGNIWLKVLIQFTTACIYFKNCCLKLHKCSNVLMEHEVSEFLRSLLLLVAHNLDLRNFFCFFKG